MRPLKTGASRARSPLSYSVSASVVSSLEDAYDTGVVLPAQPERGSHLVETVRGVGERRPETLLLRSLAHQPHVLDEDVKGALRRDELTLQHPLAPVLQHEGV